MSLQRRIAAAAAFAVAAVCLIFAPVGYLITRAKLHQEVRQELVRITAPYVQPAQPPNGGSNGNPSGISVPGQGHAPPGTPGSGDADHDNALATCTFRHHGGGGGDELGGPTG